MAKQSQSEADRLAAEELEQQRVAPKGHATPTRKEREAARKRPLVGARTPEARALSKEQQRTQMDRARAGRANGEEKYLPARERGPQKRFIRDYVDARWGFSELVFPVLIIAVVAGFFVSTSIQLILQDALYGFIVLVLIDEVVLWVTLRRALTKKFGAGKVDRIGLYAFTRAIYFRRIRIPKPQVKRGEYPS